MTLSEVINKYPKKIEEKFFLKKKNVQQSLIPPVQEKRILFIIGCQRSGTTMMQKVFEKDLKSKVYGEFSKLSYWDPKKIRLNPMDQLKREFGKVSPPLIVLKPLVETQNIDELLDYFPESKALWMFRNYKDVTASNLINFGPKNGINDLRPIVKGDPLNWRSEGASEQVRKVVSKYFSEDMKETDAAALFWYARNSLFFDLDMQNKPEIMMCRYDDLVKNPAEMVPEIYDFIDSPFPGGEIVKDINANSIGKGKDIKLNPEIEALCQGLQQRLDEVYFARQNPERPVRMKSA